MNRCINWSEINADGFFSAATSAFMLIRAGDIGVASMTNSFTAATGSSSSSASSSASELTPIDRALDFKADRLMLVSSRRRLPDVATASAASGPISCSIISLTSSLIASALGTEGPIMSSTAARASVDTPDAFARRLSSGICKILSSSCKLCVATL